MPNVKITADTARKFFRVVPVGMEINAEFITRRIPLVRFFFPCTWGISRLLPLFPSSPLPQCQAPRWDRLIGASSRNARIASRSHFSLVSRFEKCPDKSVRISRKRIVIRDSCRCPLSPLQSFLGNGTEEPGREKPEVSALLLRYLSNLLLGYRRCIGTPCRTVNVFPGSDFSLPRPLS